MLVKVEKDYDLFPLQSMLWIHRLGLLVHDKE